MSKQLFKMVLLLFIFFSPSWVYAELSPDGSGEEIPHQRIPWKLVPIEIILPVGKEKLITFPTAVEFGYDKLALPDDAIRIQNNSGALYLLAKRKFPTQRVAVRMTDSGKVILLDLSPEEDAVTTPIDIVAPDNADHSIHSIVEPLANDETDGRAREGTINYMVLTRFAVQQLYAPKRLINQPGTIYRTPMHTHKTVPLLSDGSVVAMPLASWRSGDTTVTAVLLRNMLKQVMILDARSLCGTWQAVTFYPRNKLSSIGTPTDATTAFLITHQSFSHALEACMGS